MADSDFNRNGKNSGIFLTDFSYGPTFWSFTFMAPNFEAPNQLEAPLKFIIAHSQHQELMRPVILIIQCYMTGPWWTSWWEKSGKIQSWIRKTTQSSQEIAWKWKKVDAEMQRVECRNSVKCCKSFHSIEAIPRRSKYHCSIKKGKT